MKKSLNKANTSKIFEMLYSGKSISICEALCELVHRDIHTEDAEKAISDLENNQLSFWNQYKVSDFAIAAKDLLGYGNYDGNREEIKTLISCKLQFA